jgi:hypothetical protein
MERWLPLYQVFVATIAFFKLFFTILNLRKMKKVLFALLMGIVLFITSCQKDVDLPQSAATNASGGKQESAQTAAAYNIRVEDGMLAFSDVDQFKTTLAYLENQVKEHNEMFAKQHSQLNDVDFTRALETANFNEFQPLIDFEQKRAYTSLRSVVEAKMPEWLSKPVLDINTYPRRVSVIGQELRTLVNEDYKVKIGGEILDFGVKNLDDAKNRSSASSRFSCGMMGFSGKSQLFDNDTKSLVTTVGLSPQPIGSLASGESYVFSQGSDGSWNRFSTRISVQVRGVLNKVGCTFDHIFSNFGSASNSSSASARYRAWFRIGMMANDTDILMQVNLTNLGVFDALNVDVWY